MKKNIVAPLLFSPMLAFFWPTVSFGQVPDLAAAKALWESSGLFCKNCHGKSGEGAFGPDLAGRGLSPTQFKRAVREPWGLMPAFPEPQISDAEIAALAAYFASLPKPAETGRWFVPVGADKPHAQQLFASVGCGQCHGPMPPPNFDGLVKDFTLLKELVYNHTVAMPKLEPQKPGSRLGMGNFNPLRLSEAQLREIFDWVVTTPHQ
jgi:mono/diheme cytochrome c family protein